MPSNGKEEETRSDIFDKVQAQIKNKGNEFPRIFVKKRFEVDWGNNCVTNFFKKLFGG